VANIYCFDWLCRLFLGYMEAAMTDKTPVPPVEGHYAMLRCDEVCGPMYRDVTMLNDGDREYNGFMSDLADMRWDDDGKANDSDRYDIIATIRPEAMQSAASGEVERLRAALVKILNTKPDFAYITGGRWDEPGSPYDRGILDGINTCKALARQALGGSDE
jgi:hypothetical protein